MVLAVVDSSVTRIPCGQDGHCNTIHIIGEGAQCDLSSIHSKVHMIHWGSNLGGIPGSDDKSYQHDQNNTNTPQIHLGPAVHTRSQWQL